MRTRCPIAPLLLGSSLLVATLAACDGGDPSGASFSDLAEVRVRVLDSRTGEALGGAEVRLYPLLDDGVGLRHLSDLRRWADDHRCLPAQLLVRTLEPGTELVLELGVPPAYSHVARLELTELPELPREPDEDGFLELPFEEPTGPSGWEEDPDYDGLPECFELDVLVFGPAPRTDSGDPDFGAIDPNPVAYLLPDEERRFHFVGLPGGDYLISGELSFNRFLESWSYPGFWTLSIGPGHQPPERFARRYVLEMPVSGAGLGNCLRGVVVDAASGYPRSATVDLLDRDGNLVDFSFVRGSNPSFVNDMQREFYFQPFLKDRGDYELRARSPGGQRGSAPYGHEGGFEFLVLSVK